MKTDNYLSLCLEQAAKSPLHYRHGSVVVRGGKVIGQGYNDYRPGFNGGTLKHGRIMGSALDGAAIAELKQKLKKQKGKPKQQQQQSQSIFIPFEGNGGGHHASVPLSMHSEMMAIHSALAASSSLSSTALACEKPCFKLPRSDKRKERLRREVLAKYVETICSASAATAGQTRFKSAILKLAHLNQVAHQGLHNNKVPREEESNEELEQEDLELRRSKERGRAFHEVKGGEKHHQKKKEKEKKGYQYGYQYDRHRSQTQPHTQQRSASESDECDHVLPLDGCMKLNDDDVVGKNGELPASFHQGKRKIDHKQVGLSFHIIVLDAADVEKSDKIRDRREIEPPQTQPMLLAKGRNSSTNDRKMHPRLIGADLYVARLGWSKSRSGPSCSLHKLPTTCRLEATTATSISQDDDVDSMTSSLASLQSISSSSPSASRSGSLHDELINSSPSAPTPSTPRVDNSTTLDRSAVRESRPCYRCVAYMHSVGIKRVFWTNDAGEWEGGKVRDLVDALDCSMESVSNGGGGGPTGNGVFVTKHEVLMLKRKMG